jgi:hypothetical protein
MLILAFDKMSQPLQLALKNLYLSFSLSLLCVEGRSYRAYDTGGGGIAGAFSTKV